MRSEQVYRVFTLTVDHMAKFKPNAPAATRVIEARLPAKDSALTSAGLELRVANGITFLGKFDDEFASRSSTYAGTATVRYMW